MGLMKEQAEKAQNLTEGLMFLQRASTVAEIAVALGREADFREALEVVGILQKYILDRFDERLAKQKEEMAKNVNTTTKPIAEGTKTPSTNQGVKPSPKGGNTSSTAKKAVRGKRKTK